MVSVNNERLAYARKYCGLHLEEAALRVRIDSEILKKYEEGHDYPTYSQLDRLASYYKQPLFFFFMKGQPVESKLAVAFRQIEEDKGVGLNKRVREMLQTANIYRLNLQEIYKDQNVISFSKTINKEILQDNASLIEVLRKKLNLTLATQKDFKNRVQFLEYLRSKLYSLGVYVFKDSFKADNVSGVCLYDEMFPIVLLNNKTTFNRQIFTIFHELYHIYCKETDVDISGVDEEKQCNRFAGDFLIPTEDFEIQIRNNRVFEDREYIARLADMYTVSSDAIMFKLLSLDKISKAFYRQEREGILRNINSSSSGGNYFYTRISYLGRPYIQNVFNQYYSGNITISEVGKYTLMKPVHVPKLASNLFGGGF